MRIMSNKEFEKYVAKKLDAEAPSNRVSPSDIKLYAMSIAAQLKFRHSDFDNVDLELLAALAGSVANHILLDNAFNLPALDKKPALQFSSN